MFLKRHFSRFSHLSRMSSNFFLSFFAMRSHSLSFPSYSSFSFPENLRSILARAVAASLNWICPVSLTSYCTRCHSTYGCQRSRGFSPPISHLTRQQPCVRTFFSVTTNFCDPWEWISFWSVLTLAFTLHESKCRSTRSVSSTTIMSWVISAYISPPSLFPLFYRCIFPYTFLHTMSACTLYIFVLSYVSSCVFLEWYFFFPFPSSQRASPFFTLYPVQLSYVYIWYTEYLLFLEVLHLLTSVLESATSPSRSGSTSCSTYDGGTQLHYRQQLRLEASTTQPPER